MDLPYKLKRAVTGACITLANATNSDDVKPVIEAMADFEKAGYPFPEWIKDWVNWVLEDPILSAEERFKQPKKIHPGFESMGFDHEAAAQRKLKEESRVAQAIRKAGCEEPYAKKEAAYVIASVMLRNPSGTDSTVSDLGYEWHCRTDEMQSLDNPENFEMFVEILRRELDFWQDDVTSSRRTVTKPQLRPGASPF